MTVINLHDPQCKSSDIKRNVQNRSIENAFVSKKRLYELSSQLGKQFMQISKTTLINLSYMDSIEPGFSGTLLLKLKNGCKDYVSRKYLPEFKKYLGI